MKSLIRYNIIFIEILYIMIEINFHDIYFFLYTFVFLPLFSLNGCNNDDEDDCEIVNGKKPVIIIPRIKRIIKKGDKYVDLAYAKDGNQDDRVNLQKEGTINTSKVGEYTIKYKATNVTLTQKRITDDNGACVDSDPPYYAITSLDIKYTVVDPPPPTKYDCRLSRNPNTSLYPSDHPKFPNCLKTNNTCYSVNSKGQSLCDVNCVDIKLQGEKAYKCQQAWIGTGDSTNEPGLIRSLSEKPNHIHNNIVNNKSYINTDSELPSHNYLFVREDNEEVEESPFNKLNIIVNEIYSIVGDILSISKFFNEKNLTKKMIIETYYRYFPEKFD
jgi:hypothetical protein